MISDEDRREVADLAMRALDTIAEDYGDGASLTAATLVFEVRTEGEDGARYEGNYASLARNSPFHIAGLLRAAEEWLTRPDEDESDHGD